MSVCVVLVADTDLFIVCVFYLILLLLSHVSGLHQVDSNKCVSVCGGYRRSIAIRWAIFAVVLLLLWRSTFEGNAVLALRFIRRRLIVIVGRSVTLPYMSVCATTLGQTSGEPGASGEEVTVC